MIDVWRRARGISRIRARNQALDASPSSPRRSDRRQRHRRNHERHRYRRSHQKLAAEGRLLGTSFEPDYRFLDPKLDLFYEWMLRTFHERNFTNRGLCHILKSLNFEARMRLAEVNVCDDFDRSWAQHLTALANGMATNTLRTAIDHIESHTLEQLQAQPELLDHLTRTEHEDERTLTAQVVDFYWSLQQRGRNPRADAAMAGGFENDWTHAASGASVQ